MSNEIIATPNNGITEHQSQNILPAKLKRSLTKALANISEEKALRLISQSLESDSLRRKASEIINKETVYIAKIPKKLDGDFSAGLLDFMTDSKTGENLGVLVNGENRIQGHVRIDQMSKSVDLSANIATIAIQQQMAQMTEVINDVRARVVALQEGHDRDLYGSVRGMHQQMIQMRDAKTEDTRRGLALGAITKLNDVRGRIEAAVVTTLDSMPVVPTGDSKISWEIIKDKTYLPRVIESYDRVEELVSYYLAATQLLGYAYAFLGEETSFEDIFSPCEELLDQALLQKLTSAEALYNEEIQDAWYKNPSDYLLKIQTAAHQLFLPNEDDVIELEISGEDLLEAM